MPSEARLTFNLGLTDYAAFVVLPPLMQALSTEAPDICVQVHGYLSETGNSFLALGRLAFGGLLQPDMQNRFPLTWSDRAAKVDRIKPWTATAEHPSGSARSAEAILDFMTCDWAAMAKQLRDGDATLRPRWQERPLFKMGRLSLQLPWMMAVQNNSAAVINNLRRLGARRNEAKEETRRIEERLGALFRERGFHVFVGYELPALGTEDDS